MQKMIDNPLKVLVRNHEELSHEFYEIILNGSNFYNPP